MATVGRCTALALTCAAAFAGCGSNGGSGASSATGKSADVRFADCMRSHGVPSFPDPLPGGGFPRGSGQQSPASQSATKGCISILKAGGSRQAPSDGERGTLLSFARCMRAHRVPNFPDPVTPSQVPRNTDVLVEGGMMFPVGSAIDVNSPAFQQAIAACGGLGAPAAGQAKGG